MREGLVVLQNHRMGKKSCWVEMRCVVTQVVTGEDVTMSKARAAWDRLFSALRKRADEGESLENSPKLFGSPTAPSIAPCPACPKVTSSLYQQIPSPASGAAGVEYPTPWGCWVCAVVGFSAGIWVLIF